MFQRLSLTVFSFLSVALASFAALANDNIDAVIEKVRTPSYDCPNQSLLPELEDTLALESLTSQQRFALTVQGNRILLPKNKLCSEFIGPASHFEFASHAGFLGV